MGPLISAGQRDSVQLRTSTDAAGRVPRHGARRRRLLVPPTVLTPTDPTDRMLHEEIFGPVVAVVPFDDEADAIRIANDSDFGLSGLDLDPRRRPRAAGRRGIEAGNLSVNSHSSVRYWTPFGGFKQSGLGRELGPDAPFAFTEDQERVHLALAEWWRSRSDERLETKGRTRRGRTARRQGRGRHRRRQRDRAGHRAPVRRGGREGRLRRHRRRRRGTAATARRQAKATFVQVDVTDEEQVRRAVRGRPRTPTARSTSRSTTPASRRPTTTRSSTPARRLAPRAGGQPDLGLPVLQGDHAATCASRGAGRSSTPRRSSP